MVGQAIIVLIIVGIIGAITNSVIKNALWATVTTIILSILAFPLLLHFINLTDSEVEWTWSAFGLWCVLATIASITTRPKKNDMTAQNDANRLSAHPGGEEEAASMDQPVITTAPTAVGDADPPNLGFPMNPANASIGQQVEISRGLPGWMTFAMYFWYLLLTVALLFALITWVYNAVDRIKTGQEFFAKYPGPIIPIIFLAGIFLIPIMSIFIFNLIEKVLSPKETVLSLVNVIRMDFVITEAGIYVGKQARGVSRHKHYHLYPWKYLSLYSIDNKRGIIVLRKGRSILKLKTGFSYKNNINYFNEIKNIMLSHLPPENRTPAGSKVHLNLAIPFILVFVLIVFQSIAAVHLTDISTGKLGDGFCDAGDQRKATYEVLYTSNTNSIFEAMTSHREHTTVKNEYCLLHSLAFAIAYPHTAITSAQAAKLVDDETEGWSATEQYFDLLFAAIVSVICWLIIISISIKILVNIFPESLIKWLKTPVLHQ